MSVRAALRGLPAGRLRRRLALVVGLATLGGIGGCSDSRPPSPETSALVSPASLAPASLAQTSTIKLAYAHDLIIGLPADRVAAHFTSARNRCLTDPALTCVLVSSALEEAARPSGRPQAQLQVRLPHGAVAPYLAFVTAPLDGEQAADVVVRRQATRADDLTARIEDGERRLTQRKAYRERLDVLAAKPDTRVEDLIRIAQELAQVQSQIEEEEAKQRGLQQRVDTETVALSFRSDQARSGPFAPVEEAWVQAGATLGASAGAALRFAIVSLPWLPLLAIAMLVLRGLWRLRRRRRGGLRRPLPRERP